MVTSKIKALLALKNKKNVELAKYLEMTPQSLRNKFSRGSFSVEDLIKIANFCDCKVVIEIEENQKIVLDMEDIRE